MTRNPEWIRPETTLENAAVRMRELDIGFIPVGDGVRLQGVITDRDITRSIAADACADNRIEYIMTREVIFVTPSSTIIECVRKLESFQISAMPVLDGDQLVGVVSGDLLATRSLFRLLQVQQ